MHSKALSSFSEVHTVFICKPTYVYSAGTRTNITTHEAGSNIYDLSMKKVHKRTTLHIQSPYLSINLAVSKGNAYEINTPMHHIQLGTSSYHVRSS